MSTADPGAEAPDLTLHLSHLARPSTCTCNGCIEHLTCQIPPLTTLPACLSTSLTVSPALIHLRHGASDTSTARAELQPLPLACALTDAPPCPSPAPMSAALIERGRALRSPPKPPPASPPPDYLAPFLPPSQSALAPPSLSASLLFSPSPSHLLTSSYLQQRRRHYSPSAWSSLLSSLSTTTTLYLGNLSFTTREETVHHFFSSAGPIHSLYMGLNAHTHHPCGFCFIRFRTAEGARRARWTLSGMKVDGRVCGVDFDQEFRAGRQWGRGKTGGQIRDDHRSSYDEGRGGWGLREKLKQQQRRMQDEQVTQFKPIREGEEEKTGGEEEADSGSGQVQLKREKGSYKEAHALRKAGAAAITASAVEAGVKQEGMEEKAEDEPASQCHSPLAHSTAAVRRPELSCVVARADCAVQVSGGECRRRKRRRRSRVNGRCSRVERRERAALTRGPQHTMGRWQTRMQVRTLASSRQRRRGTLKPGVATETGRVRRAVTALARMRAEQARRRRRWSTASPLRTKRPQTRSGRDTVSLYLHSDCLRATTGTCTVCAVTRSTSVTSCVESMRCAAHLWRLRWLDKGRACRHSDARRNTPDAPSVPMPGTPLFHLAPFDSIFITPPALFSSFIDTVNPPLT